MSMFVPWSVCLFVYERISETTYPNFTKLFFLHVAYARGLVVVWRCCNILCTSGFVDNVMFSYKGPYGSVTLPHSTVRSTLY